MGSLLEPTTAAEEWKEVATKGMAAYRAPSLAQPHKARQALRDAYKGKIAPLLGFFLAYPNVPTARVVAQLGADIVWVDWEHGACSVETITDVVYTLQFGSEGRTMAFVRVPNHEHAFIGDALSAGASVIVPQVDTVEQAKHVVEASKFGYKCRGTRSAPPARWLAGCSSSVLAEPSLALHENLNKQAALIIQIESELGIRNLDAILTAVSEQIDAVWIGMLDLRVSLGLPGSWGDEADFLELVRLYEETLHKHRMPNSGACFDGSWKSGQCNKVFSVVSGDFLALLGQRDWLSQAREKLPPTDMQEHWHSV